MMKKKKTLARILMGLMRYTGAQLNEQNRCADLFGYVHTILYMFDVCVYEIVYVSISLKPNHFYVSFRCSETLGLAFFRVVHTIQYIQMLKYCVHVHVCRIVLKYTFWWIDLYIHTRIVATNCALHFTVHIELNSNRTECNIFSSLSSRLCIRANYIHFEI